MKKLIIGITAAVALSVPGVASASVSSPTVGDVVRYEFVSDVAYNESTTWFDADSEIAQYTETHLPRYNPKNGHYWGTQSFTSRSTYQSTVASIQTSGYFAQCFVFVNGTQTGEDHATGKYAVATCSG